MQTNKQKNSEVRNDFFKLPTAEECLGNIPPILRKFPKRATPQNRYYQMCFLAPNLHPNYRTKTFRCTQVFLYIDKRHYAFFFKVQKSITIF